MHRSSGRCSRGVSAAPWPTSPTRRRPASGEHASRLSVHCCASSTRTRWCSGSSRSVLIGRSGRFPFADPRPSRSSPCTEPWSPRAGSRAGSRTTWVCIRSTKPAWPRTTCRARCRRCPRRSRGGYSRSACRLPTSRWPSRRSSSRSSRRSRCSTGTRPRERRASPSGSRSVHSARRGCMRCEPSVPGHGTVRRTASGSTSPPPSTGVRRACSTRRRPVSRSSARHRRSRRARPPWCRSTSTAPTSWWRRGA